MTRVETVKLHKKLLTIHSLLGKQSSIIIKLRHALEKIRDEDYRGQHPEAHFIAKRALEETE